MYLYREILDPDLYDCKFAAQFVESLHEPEILSASDAHLNSLKQCMMATDDIQLLADPLVEKCQQHMLNSGTVTPLFTAFPEKDRKVHLELGYNLPTQYEDIQRYISACKALGMIQQSQCAFFRTLQPIRNDKPVFGNDVSESDEWGIMVIGSSLRGNCFIQLFQIIQGRTQMHFHPLCRKILREGQYSYPFSRFFYISSAEEMCNVIKQIPKLLLRSTLSERECLINFATTLKALHHFGYRLYPKRH